MLAPRGANDAIADGAVAPAPRAQVGRDAELELAVPHEIVEPLVRRAAGVLFVATEQERGDREVPRASERQDPGSKAAADSANLAL